jgi:hypothetical protein
MRINEIHCICLARLARAFRNAVREYLQHGAFVSVCDSNTVSITFHNTNKSPLYIQVDPWAGIYQLKQGERIEFLAESKSGAAARFEVHEDGNARYLMIYDSSEYFIVQDGLRIHWTDLPANFELPIGSSE